MLLFIYLLVYSFMYLFIYWALWHGRAALMGEWLEGACPRPLSALGIDASHGVVQKLQAWAGEAALSSGLHQI